MFEPVTQMQPAWLNGQCPREGRYVLGPLLGSGGMGFVHEAWDVVLCRTVALKILKDIEPPALIRFMHEAQIHARVVHPNICRIYDVDNYHGALRVAMQLVQGPSLEQACRELSVQELVTILAQVSQAVHAVHRLHLVHRDLKPSNILLERNSEGRWTPFVCDFGLAMALDEPSLTYSHGILGTPAYMAPEQLRGDRDRVSAATDVYALGGTLHYALTGRPPSGPSDSWPQSRSGGSLGQVPRELRAIIIRCLKEEPEQRYSSASALEEDLWRFRDGLPVRTSLRKGLDRRSRTQLQALRPYLLALAATAAAAWAILGQRNAADLRQQAVRAERIDLQALELARACDLERTLPAHDLRPRYAGIRAQAERFQADLARLGRPWQAHGHFALGTAALLCRDVPGAAGELERAWSGGFQEPAVALPLTWVTVLRTDQAERAAQFAGQGPATMSAPVPAWAEALYRSAGTDGTGTAGLAQALMACLHGDTQGGADAALADFQSRPWSRGSAILAVRCLVRLGGEALAAGRMAKAREQFQSAADLAEGALARSPSDPDLAHGCDLARRGLGCLGLETGMPDQAWLRDQLRASAQTLLLDPDDPDLQDDWLALQSLVIQQRIEQGQDARDELEEAKAFFADRVRTPMPPALQADRMVLFTQQARLDFDRGRDPAPALAEALKSTGHTPFLGRDRYQDLLTLQVAAAARAADPRPAMDTALQRLGPLGEEAASWTDQESAAELWLVRADWEAQHGLDPMASIRKAQALAEAAQRQNPDSAAAAALDGLAQVQAAKALPAQSGRLLALARERLRQSRRLAPSGRLQRRLALAL